MTEEEKIAAYVDGALNEIESRRIEKAMAADDVLATKIAAERTLRSTLSGHFDAVLDEPVPDRLTAMLTNVDTSFAARKEAQESKKSRMFNVTQWGAMAATLAIGFMVGNLGTGAGSSSLVTTSSNAVIAQGALADALETQLASAQTGQEAVRIGLTFRDGEGTACRSFEAAALSGIACKEGDDWQLRRSFEGKADSQYRQASSSAVLEAVASLMQGEPLDADAEKALQAKSWE